MKQILNLLAAVLALWLLPALPALAQGTAAGTSITNKASVSFVVDTTTVNQESNQVIIQVAEVLDVTLQWQDASNILAKPGDTGKVATFLLTNTGNGSESFSLTVDNAVAGNQFNPVLSGLYLDGNGNNQYDAGTDSPYNAGVNDPLLAADGSLYLFVVDDIPAGANDSELGKSRLSATAETGSGVAGTVFAGAGDGGINALTGTSGATAATEATLQISSVDVVVNKSAVVTDPWGGNEPAPTATIAYTITITASGSGTAKGVTVTDPVPSSTTYNAGTLYLDGASLTDLADADEGEVSGGNVTVRLGDMLNTAKTVTFQVIID